jgi:hypothetical protein
MPKIERYAYKSDLIKREENIKKKFEKETACIAPLFGQVLLLQSLRLFQIRGRRRSQKPIFEFISVYMFLSE